MLPGRGQHGGIWLIEGSQDGRIAEVKAGLGVLPHNPV